MCEEFAVYSVPTVMVYQESYSEQGEKYTGKMDWKHISAFATRKMQSFVSHVTLENYEQFLARDASKYKVLLFTQRKTTAPIFKALSKKYKDKLLFGEVRDSERKIIDKFGVKEYPTLMVVTDPYEGKGDIYKGDKDKIDMISKFLNPYSYKHANYARKMEVKELNMDTYSQGLCAKKSTNICLIVFEKSLLSAFEKLIASYDKDHIDFVFADKHKLSSLHQQFGNRQHKIVAYKPKYSKFLAYKDADYSEDRIKDFIDKVVGGGGEFEKF